MEIVHTIGYVESHIRADVVDRAGVTEGAGVTVALGV